MVNVLKRWVVGPPVSTGRLGEAGLSKRIALPVRRIRAGGRHGVHPEYVVARWWENVLHNRTALRLKARLLQQPGVVVVNVPFHRGRRERGWLAGDPEVAASGPPA